MRLVTVGVSAKFDSAHNLPSHPSKCRQMHGHTWHVEVEVTGTPDLETGMVIDFSALKTILGNVVDTLDHTSLNLTFDNPTCENIALYISGQLKVKGLSSYVLSVKVREGEGGWACSKL